MTRILVVDDTEDARRLLAMLLEQEGYEVQAVASGFDALEVLATDRPDLIVLDMMMPRMDGLSLFKKVREQPALSKLPVLFYSAWWDSELVKQVMLLGAAGYLVKGRTKFDQFLDEVRKVAPPRPD